jgi:signal recognition particle receptor subunit alpha
VYQSLLHISWVDKLLENVRALFTELYREKLSTPRKTTTDYQFEPYFERQVQELEKSEESVSVPSINVAPSSKETKQVEPAAEPGIADARSLGMLPTSCAWYSNV